MAGFKESLLSPISTRQRSKAERVFFDKPLVNNERARILEFQMSGKVDEFLIIETKSSTNGIHGCQALLNASHCKARKKRGVAFPVSFVTELQFQIIPGPVVDSTKAQSIGKL